MSTKASASVLLGEVITQLERSGRVDELGARLEAAPADGISVLGAAWLRHREGRGIGRVTLDGNRLELRKIRETLREVGCETADRWSVEAFTAGLREWRRQGLAQSTVYKRALVWWQVWRWAASQPARFPGVAVPPYDSSLVLPVPPKRSHAPIAPTWRELDDVIGRLKAPWKPVAIVLRYTGLRVSQVLALEGRDLELDDQGKPALRIRVGKSAAERALQRQLPLAEPAHAILLERRRRKHDVLFPGRSKAGTLGRTAMSDAVAQAVAASIAAEKSRAHAWQPPGRRRGRPVHGFRATFATELVTAGVRESVVQALLGHAPSSTSQQRYAQLHASTYPDQRAAVDSIPPIRAPGD